MKKKTIINSKEQYIIYKIRNNHEIKRRVITLDEALERDYYVKAVRNNYGDYSSGRINLPKCLIGKYVKLKYKKKNSKVSGGGK